MNFEESTSFLQEESKKERKKKVVIATMILCAILIVLSFLCIFMIQYKDSQTLKFLIDNTEQNITSTLFKDIDGKQYINLYEISRLLGYNYTNGEYNEYNEEPTSCYITNKFETVSFTAEQTHFIKYVESLQESTQIATVPVTIKTKSGTAEKYTLQEPIKYVEEKIYIPFESMREIFNVQIDLSQENKIKIFTLDQIIANVLGLVGRYGYSTLSGDYENLKASLYGLAVVGDGKKFGVISLADNNAVIGLKYEDITFMPNLQNFLIKTGSTVGICSKEGLKVIEPTEYDEISVYDENLQLYLVRKDKKYGILNKLGKVVIYPDYDSIGYKVSSNETEENECKILFNKCIPVKEGSKYGLFNIQGEKLLDCLYDELGSEHSIENDSSNEKAVLEIPREVGIEGIVINQNGMYGIYDVEAENIIIPIVCSKVYSVTKEAKTSYYVIFNEQQIELESYLEMNNLKSIKEDTENKEENNATQDLDETTETSTEGDVSSTEEVPEEQTPVEPNESEEVVQ